jgi:hypothetical protein
MRWTALAAASLLAAALCVPAQAQVVRGAVLRGLNKITGQAQDFDGQIGKAKQFGTLQVTVKACEKAPPEDPPEVKAYLEITDTPAPRRKKETPETKAVFAGWMFASSPALNALEHPTYDVWVIDCRT